MDDATSATAPPEQRAGNTPGDRSRRRQGHAVLKVRKNFMLPAPLARRLRRLAQATGTSEASIAVEGIRTQVHSLERQLGRLTRQADEGGEPPEALVAADA